MTTISSLLNALHSHLQSQTCLLPSLHTQLGLPASALEDDLAALEHQLTQCVQSHIHTRRQQVDDWIHKCTEKEQECTRYNYALGTSPSTTVPSREHVLPVRYETISQQHHHLAKLYHTNLQHILTLTSHLSNLALTLGNDFFSPDVLLPTPAQGENEYDPNAFRDVSPQRLARLQAECDRGKEELKRRTENVAKLWLAIDWLYGELGIEMDVPPTLTNTMSSSLLAPEPFLATSTPLAMSQRSSTPTPPFLPSHPRASSPFPSFQQQEPEEYAFKRAFLRFTAHLDTLPPAILPSPSLFQSLLTSPPSSPPSSSPPVPQEILSFFGTTPPTPPLFGWSTTLHAELTHHLRARHAHIQALYDALDPLWQGLSVDTDYIDSFVEKHRGSTGDIVSAYEEELERMREKRKERIGEFVIGARRTVWGLWAELGYLEHSGEGNDEEGTGVGEPGEEVWAGYGEEGGGYKSVWESEEYSEEVLAAHEAEVERLKEEKRVKGPLLACVKRYFDILGDQRALAEASADQSRLLGRGPRGDPGRLLREEKMRKRVQKEKPKLELELLNSIPAWETEHGRPFIYLGRSMVQVLMEATAGKKGGSGGAKAAGKAGANTPSNANNNQQSQGQNGNSGAGFAPKKGRAAGASVGTGVGVDMKPQGLNGGGIKTRLRSASASVGVGVGVGTMKDARSGKPSVGGRTSIRAPTPTTKASTHAGQGQGMLGSRPANRQVQTPAQTQSFSSRPPAPLPVPIVPKPAQGGGGGGGDTASQAQAQAGPSRQQQEQGAGGILEHGRSPTKAKLAGRPHSHSYHPYARSAPKSGTGSHHGGGGNAQPQQQQQPQRRTAPAPSTSRLPTTAPGAGAYTTTLNYQALIEFGPLGGASAVTQGSVGAGAGMFGGMALDSNRAAREARKARARRDSFRPRTSLAVGSVPPVPAPPISPPATTLASITSDATDSGVALSSSVPAPAPPASSSPPSPPPLSYAAQTQETRSDSGDSPNLDVDTPMHAADIDKGDDDNHMDVNVSSNDGSDHEAIPEPVPESASELSLTEHESDHQRENQDQNHNASEVPVLENAEAKVDEGKQPQERWAGFAGALGGGEEGVPIEVDENGFAPL